MSVDRSTPTAPQPGSKQAASAVPPLLCALLLLAAIAPPLRAAWPDFLEDADYPARQFVDTPLVVIIRDIFNAAERAYPDARRTAVEIHPAPGVDLEKLLSVRIPDLSTAQALAYVGRRADLEIEVQGNRVLLAPAPRRAPGIRPELEEQITLQQLLFLALADPGGELDSELRHYAGRILSQAPMVKTSAEELPGRPPPEYVAFYLLLHQQDARSYLESLLPAATPAGYIYLAALLKELEAEPIGPQNGPPVAMREAEGLIILMAASTVYREQVTEGALRRSVFLALKQQP